MRFSASLALALPLLAAAANSPFEEYKAKFQNFLGSFGAKPAEPKASPDAAPAADKASAKTQTLPVKEVKVLTLQNWNETLFAPVAPAATQPEEWYVLITGGNKTCFGHCTKLETAFNESAALLATTTKPPHLALLNCDDEPVLCNAWAAGTGHVWSFEMVPRPAPVDVYYKRLYLTTTTPQTIVDLHTAGNKDAWTKNDGHFHPYNGPLAHFNLLVPIGYFFWGFNAIPSWATMVVISFMTRRMMNRRMDPGMGARGAGPAAAAPAGAAR